MTTSTLATRRRVAAALLAVPALLAACGATSPDDPDGTGSPAEQTDPTGLPSDDADAGDSDDAESTEPAEDDVPAGGGGTAGELAETDGVRTLVAAEPAAGGAGGTLAGRLLTGPGGCLALEMVGENRPEGGAPIALIIWPPGTDAAAIDRPGVDVEGLTVALSDEIQATGVLAPPGDLAATIPAECVLGDDVVWIHGDVTIDSTP
ncbi:CCR4; not-complex component [Beutenbergia cavernae DSM 12333]|uniref:CCR4 not-complex component n=1 Tax=Beutenbergia cavernae (strain ATCC BAA-8 / DSM 12333 / CCUG 43141 / JCM 11478 / NBRC 16432 / NCIMB 13614 / HKI 0122) TaxID=471853 RepID=C5C4M1_BEUC1|nr:hypothetical protein [Beutenbergia cavernae]ACQ82145.1 CCR4; not-complex component [Beutenbergia cavernae DSM 12333]